MFLRSVGTGLICLGLLAFEILTTRLLSVVIDPSTILYAIAFAMLGMTAATSLMSLRTSESGGLLRPDRLGWVGFALGLSYLAALFLISDFNEAFNGALEQAIDIGGQVLIAETMRATLFGNMALIGSVLFLPYFLFGCFIALLFQGAQPGEYTRLYAADLIGAAGGCVLAVAALDEIGFAGCVVLLAGSTFLGAAAFGLRNSGVAVVVNGLAVAALVVAAAIPGGYSAFEPRPALGQMARNWERAYDASEVWTVWNAHSRLGLLETAAHDSGERRSVYSHDRGEGWAWVPGSHPFRTPALIANMFAPKRSVPTCTPLTRPVAGPARSVASRSTASWSTIRSTMARRRSGHSWRVRTSIWWSPRRGNTSNATPAATT
jgi:hypothetical protein